MMTELEASRITNLLYAGTFVIISGDDPLLPAVRMGGQQQVLRIAKNIAISPVVELVGLYKYGGSFEQSCLIEFDDPERARKWGNNTAVAFGQESYIVGHKGTYTLHYHPNAHKPASVGHGITWFDTPPDCFYSMLPSGETFRLNLD
jgi:hypothetical protein